MHNRKINSKQVNEICTWTKNPLSQTVDCRKNFSTVHALIDSIENAFEKSKFVCRVFIVLKKAFDTFFYSSITHFKTKNLATFTRLYIYIYQWQKSRVREEQVDILPSHVKTEKITGLADNFLQNEYNFFLCSQFRLEENFSKWEFFFAKCVSSFTELKKTIHCRLPPCSKLSPCCFSQHWNARNKFGPCCSKCNNYHTLMFLQFGYSKSDIIRMWK